MPARRPRSSVTGPSAEASADVNLEVAGWLLDYAVLQPSDRQRHAYSRAAHAVFGVARPLPALLHGSTLAKIPYVGPSSTRVILEVLENGRSPTVERALAESGRSSDLEARRRLRRDFISQARAEAVLARAGGDVVTLEDYRGDFQMHSTWSDGDQTLRDIVEAGIALGHACAGVTDHSYGLPVARGMSMEAAARQGAEILALNEEYRGRFRLFHGVEANIRADGDLDLSPDERLQFDFVVASPHSALRSHADQTGRMLAAVRQPGVDILGHPRGRRFDVRPGVTAEWPRVFAAAASRGVAIEIDGYPDRQDVDWRLAVQALEAGCVFALDSDAHGTGELLFSRMAVAHARLAGIPASRVVNCWSDAAIEDWVASRRGRRGPVRTGRTRRPGRTPRS
jgi:histidinol phosphatase-like PHP family hydrolase